MLVGCELQKFNFVIQSKNWGHCTENNFIQNMQNEIDSIEANLNKCTDEAAAF